MASEVQLTVGTKRGLFLLRSADSRQTWSLSGPFLEGREVYHAFVDPRDGRTAWAATRHEVWGAHVHRSGDGGESWEVLEEAPRHSDARGLTAIWHLAPGHPAEPDTLYAGIEPAGLAVSRDRGRTWQAVDTLNRHGSSVVWQAAGGGLALGSIQVDPRTPERLYCAVSAGGVYRSDDGGRSWSPANTGVRADFLPRRFPEAGQCVHKLRLHPAMPDRLYQQNHCGVYRSDDRGERWTEITAGLPSEFGYAMSVDPHDADTAFVIPEESSHMRTVVGGKLRVYRTEDAGESWHPLARGLPAEQAWVSILREGLDSDHLDPCGVYFGTSTGHVFGSRNGGESWSMLAGYLPRVLSVSAAVVTQSRLTTERAGSERVARRSASASSASS